MLDRFVVSDTIAARFDRTMIDVLSRPCRPKILVVHDGLSYSTTNAFGLTRFLEGITIHNSITRKPEITLARKGSGGPATVTIGTDTYNVLMNYQFDNATTGVTLARYDQVWIFGIGPAPFSLSTGEVAALSAFMNGGGGVFATGDHATLGHAMCGSLPRIRHMREWAAIPMGNEVPSTAVNRIDTVVDPGSGGLYEFDDQADEIPQRIYPNYKVTGTTSTNWQATVHRILMMPGAPTGPRSTSAGFTQDVDVLPDHPHESVCYGTPSGVLAGMYTVAGQNFEEYRPLAADPTQRVGAEIVAYAVSGGRSVSNFGVWKPPVRPQMFGVISAYDGRLAQPYSGTARPGRIVCDSTWHHFVNVNLDGSSTGRSGLGTVSGGVFTPGPALMKIYTYYCNMIAWLQPANRIFCRLYWELAELRYHAILFEELIELDRFKTWDDQVALGRTAAAVLAGRHGEAYVEELVSSVLLRDQRQEGLGDLFTRARREEFPIDTTELALGALGASLVRMAEQLPFDDDDKALAVLERGVEKNVHEPLRAMSEALEEGFNRNEKRAERALEIYKDKKLRKALRD